MKYVAEKELWLTFLVSVKFWPYLEIPLVSLILDTEDITNRVWEQSGTFIGGQISHDSESSLRNTNGLKQRPKCTGKKEGSNPPLTLILRRSRTGTVWFYTSTSNKRAARPKLYTKSLTRDLKRMYSRLPLVRISIKL